MWTVIYVASDEDVANKIKDKLTSEGFLVKIRSLSKKRKGIYEVLVPEAEAEDAHNILVTYNYC
ncbi:SPOR domain-containing protein [Caldanaerobius polysaccharolyticus]|uniref:SPOR domain-containing protein n=1 Tax=Caldanaerobius polysaccharolyticus TaxID=44256 RepID=UPI000478A9FC|nr:hypothetical protein [Caldanaerobius polysaccharolyticus]